MDIKLEAIEHDKRRVRRQKEWARQQELERLKDCPECPGSSQAQ